MRRALLVVDVQRAFDDVAYWGHRDNPRCEANIADLMGAWRSLHQPIVRVVHDSTEPGSPLRPGLPGHALKPEVDGPVDLEVHKSVHSSFHGTPDLAAWLRAEGIEGVAVCGITTNMCCETTARVAADLGFDLWFVIDATTTFDLPAVGGSIITAAQLSRATAAVLAADFGRVLTTDEVIAAVVPTAPA